MFPYPLSLSVIPTGTLDMTADFAPLFIGMVVGLSLCVLGLAFAIGIHDTWRAQRQAKQTTDGPTPVSEAA